MLAVEESDVANRFDLTFFFPNKVEVQGGVLLSQWGMRERG